MLRVSVSTSSRQGESIITMAETIKIILMLIIAMKKAAAKKYGGPLCPKIQSMLNRTILDSNKC